ncbi:MAG TPA: ABC-2 transporter permease [Bryobacteraceae bacterium]|jgi:ABC-type Na+ efflux pump permease subunit
MNAQTSVVRQMVWKDIQMHRKLMASLMIFGAAGLGLFLVKREPYTVLGGIALFTALILTSAFVPGSNILNERKRQTLPFLMSLPISAIQYTTAKLLSTVGMFLIPWTTLVIAAIWMIAVEGVLPHGAIPMALMLLTLPFVNVCGITAMNLVGETEGWNGAAQVIFNSVPGVIWYLITLSPALTRDLGSSQAVWNPTVLTFLGSEFAVIVLILALTYYLQSRKRDFV